MPGISFATYFAWTYVVLPLIYKSLSVIHDNYYEICPVIRCIKPLAICLQEPLCRSWLDDIAQCSDPQSNVREASRSAFAHVQHPDDPAFCRYQSFDRLETETALSFLECIGSSGCMEPSPVTDICSDMSQSTIIPLKSITSILGGAKWNKLYTTGWDIWPCQWTEFWPPNSSSKAPEAWMKNWPSAPDVWRMDLYWKNGPKEPVTFHMNNEMYPEETWDFDFAKSTNEDISSSRNASHTRTTPASLKTRAVMWGTEAHENWYILDFNPELQTLLIYYCAHTEAVDRFDSIAMILQKDGAPTLTLEQTLMMESQAAQLLSIEPGILQKISPCPR